MSTRLYVDAEARLNQQEEPGIGPQSIGLRAVANIISYVFHPLFVPVYMVLFLTVTPPFFVGVSEQNKLLMVVRFIVMYSFFPFITVLLLKGLGFIDSIFLRTQRERIIPFVATGVYYFWMWYVLRKQPVHPALVELSLAIFLASSVGLLLNIYMKVSLHAMSMGVMLGFLCILALTETASYTMALSITCLLTGLVCTSRLIVSNHRPVEIYTGVFTGILAILTAWAVDFLSS
ncbi:MAG: hypothetical protein J0H92_10165 [Sphingobacteriales bacterium]|jgi:hypothetical protein|nr:hypothetical protein [Sphingobacteriales bacterium]NCT74576.1 hypothetical protein [Chitinophagaceae bacterium]OJW32387.1 MAG: hypothetical protein BGO54_18500 [Sphingobacteriales bacterium 46-32]